VPQTNSSHAFDDQFDLRSRNADFQEYFDKNDSLSAEAIEALPCQLDISYGNHPLQAVDYFPAKQGNAPIVIFIHGGYWRALDKKSYSFVAPSFIDSNCAVCSVNYRLAPEARLEEILDDVTKALRSIREHATAINGNPNDLYVTGHSAGGHLALMTAMLLQEKNDPLLSSIKGVLSLSGLFDLDPVRNSFLNETLNFDDSTVTRLSPILNEAFSTNIPLRFAVGGDETDEFIRQSQTISERMTANGNDSQYSLLSNLNHFDIVYELGKPDGVLKKQLLEMIR
jgi:arylformamidase